MRASTFLVPTALLGAVSLSACAGRFSQETPPANAKPLSEIVKSLEDQGYKDVERIEIRRQGLGCRIASAWRQGDRLAYQSGDGANHCGKTSPTRHPAPAPSVPPPAAPR